MSIVLGQAAHLQKQLLEARGWLKRVKAEKRRDANKVRQVYYEDNEHLEQTGLVALFPGKLKNILENKSAPRLTPLQKESQSWHLLRMPLKVLPNL